MLETADVYHELNEKLRMQMQKVDIRINKGLINSLGLIIALLLLSNLQHENPNLISNIAP